MDILKNDEYTLMIDGYTSEGAGVGRIDGYPVFVPNTVHGDIAKVRIVKPGKSFAYGKCMDILTPSAERIEPVCPHFYACGGCAVMHLSSEERARFKREKVKNALLHIAGVDFDVDETECGEDLGYRNKTQMPVTDGYEQAMYKLRSNEKVAVPHCVIQDDSCKKVTAVLLGIFKEKGIPPYNPNDGSGIVRHIYTRVSQSSGEILVIVVAKKKIDLSDMKKELLAHGVVGLLLNINPEPTSRILGDETITVFGKNHITDRLCGTDFDIYADSFFQVNKFLTERLYNKAVKLLSLTGKETVFDLYCGAGTITAALARHANRVIGVEIVPSAVRSARQSLKRAGIENAEIYEGASEILAPQMIINGERADAVVVDPPRKGCTKELLDALIAMKPKKIVYVSCDPATMARDAKMLIAGGYEIKRVTPFDMFPFTEHVECVVCMQRKDTSV